jgi:hypothetical protein
MTEPKRQQFPTRVRPISTKATEEDELPRDEDGCIYDEQVARDREQLRRQLAEEEGEVVLYSENGYREDWGKGLYKAMSGLAVGIKEFDCS